MPFIIASVILMLIDPIAIRWGDRQIVEYVNRFAGRMLLMLGFLMMLGGM